MLTVIVIAIFVFIRLDAPWYLYLLGAATALVDLFLEAMVFLIALKQIVKTLFAQD
jgi:hypothetical protein